ncbi:MAG: carbamoyltransferase HypF, partial [Anaerolineae bacterium]|nr:carbamoyltransferase HypF [Anaerolineae bacterium]
MATRADQLARPQGQGARRVAIKGVVQGVGFRPFLYRLAHEHHLAGWVRNTSWGVEMEIEGSPASLERFLAELPQKAPPIARIESLEVEEIAPNGHQEFRILHSQAQAGAYQLISPDIATCADCLREIFDPHDRRYRYPFTNCTNCGPRFTIIESIPYDRPRTTMRAFTMCPDCQREYDDPLDRRFHAQPNACPVCGPHLSLLDVQGRLLAERDAALRRAEQFLRQGKIVALKGLGGYQLACDATNAQAVRALRARKRRPHKPFAIMVADLDAVAEHAYLNEEERKLLSSPAAPIVLLRWREGSSIVPEVAPHSHIVGIMLPYTPLHHLLLRDLALPLVMTSGNLTEEPIARDNDEALRRLQGIADYFLVHNRDIYSRYDDSVAFVPAGGPQLIRRARGYAPFPIRLPFATRPILACGAELKNTFCLTRDQYAFLSQHIGDMENLETLAHYEETVALYQRLFHIEPELIVHDMHPDYMSTRYALEQDKPRLAVQHHHAHLAACLADRGFAGPAIGVIMDGTGLGLDGHIWGG